MSLETKKILGERENRMFHEEGTNYSLLRKYKNQTFVGVVFVLCGDG